MLMNITILPTRKQPVNELTHEEPNHEVNWNLLQTSIPELFCNFLRVWVAYMLKMVAEILGSTVWKNGYSTLGWGGVSKKSA